MFFYAIDESVTVSRRAEDEACCLRHPPVAGGPVFALAPIVQRNGGVRGNGGHPTGLCLGHGDVTGIGSLSSSSSGGSPMLVPAHGSSPSDIYWDEIYPNFNI